jgi:DNA-binding MarR family transcriptional regulator
LRLVRDLAVDLDVTVPTISAAVESLVRRGLVKRGVADGDRRVVPLLLTDEGQSALHAARDRQFAALLDVLAVLNADERASLASSVGVLSRALLESGQRST